MILSLGSTFSMTAHAAVLALRFRPELASTLLHIALRCDPVGRARAAAALAVIDQPWSRRELAAVLDGSNDPDETFLIRPALRQCREHGARAAACTWERENLGTVGAEAGCVGEDSDKASRPCENADEVSFRRWLDRLRPVISEVRSPAPYTDIVSRSPE